MTDPRRWYSTLLETIRANYMRAYRDSGRLGFVPLERAGALRDAMREGLSFSDLLTASALRHRALGTRVDTSRGLDMETLRERNPWLRGHQVQMTPIVKARVDALLKAETQHLARQAELRSASRSRALPSPNAALARGDMLYRHAVSAVANVSEQVQLAIPEIGSAFPIGHYLTRDDRRVRPTHKAMYGFLAGSRNEIWADVRPPCGFNCRCYIRWITWPETRRRGWLVIAESDELRWPNSASKRNYEQHVFPDPGWSGNKIAVAA